MQHKLSDLDERPLLVHFFIWLIYKKQDKITKKNWKDKKKIITGTPVLNIFCTCCGQFGGNFQSNA